LPAEPDARHAVRPYALALGSNTDSRQDPVALRLGELEFDVLASATAVEPVTGSFLALRLKLVSRERTGGIAFEHLDHAIAPGGLNNVAELSGLQRKRSVFERFVRDNAAPDPPKITALVLGGRIRRQLLR